MKNKKKLEYIAKIVEQFEDNPALGLDEISCLLGIQDKEEPEPEFELGDQVEFDLSEEDLILNDFVWRVDATKKGDLGIATKISTWLPSATFLKKVKY